MSKNTKQLQEKEISMLSAELLKWFNAYQRDLPWRAHYRPYEVWISEIMLQQTQMKTMLPYFERWMRTLPTIKSVAEAKEDMVLKLWEGLGYYSRVRNLQRAAKVIMEKHGGQFPKKYEEILALPGIGKYTAAAISSIAFNQNHAVVDGNVIRVLSRFFDLAENAKLPTSQKKIEALATELLPHGKARLFNQAMMEFGALQCVPKNPDCSECPLKKKCQAYKKGTVSRRPNLGPKKSLESIEVALAVIWKEGRVLIQKRPGKGLMGGLWEFPGGKVEEGETVRQALVREVKEETGITLKNIRFVRKIKHNYTRFKVTLHCYEADFAKGTNKVRGQWTSPKKLSSYPFPAANVKLIEGLLS